GGGGGVRGREKGRARGGAGRGVGRGGAPPPVDRAGVLRVLAGPQDVAVTPVPRGCRPGGSGPATRRVQDPGLVRADGDVVFTANTGADPGDVGAVDVQRDRRARGGGCRGGGGGRWAG